MGRTTEMRRRKVWIPAVLVTLLAVGLIAQASAGNGPGATVLKFNTMAGVVAPYLGPANAIRGIPGGGAPWSIDQAQGTLEEYGDLQVEDEELKIIPTGSNAYPTVHAGVSWQSID